MNRLAFISTLIGFSLLAGVANSTTPASPEQVLCSNSVAFVGTVIEARSHDCRNFSEDKYCSGTGIVGATVKIKEMVQPVPKGFDPAQMINLAMQALNSTPIEIGGKTFALNITGGGMIGFPATGKGISDSEARQVLVGKQYVFAITNRNTDKPWLIEPYFAVAYQGSQGDWARQEWSSSACDRWRRN